MKRYNAFGAGVIGLLIIGILFFAGCGPKMMPPHDKIANAEMAINRAREVNAIVYAPLDLKLSEEKLAAAKQAMSTGNYETANRQADESILDAQTAEAKSKAEKAKELSQKMQDNIESLRQELDRTSN
jgi:hypothetical protein